MRLSLRLKRSGFPDLYEVADLATGETYSIPLPWDEANQARKNVQSQLTAAEALQPTLDWLGDFRI